MTIWSNMIHLMTDKSRFFSSWYLALFVRCTVVFIFSVYSFYSDSLSIALLLILVLLLLLILILNVISSLESVFRWTLFNNLSLFIFLIYVCSFSFQLIANCLRKGMYVLCEIVCYHLQHHILPYHSYL